MAGKATAGVLRFFADLEDPRAHNVMHKLHDMLVIALFAVICGAQSWADVELFGKTKRDWLKTFLELPHGIPSHDTFGRLFARLNPDHIEACFRAWMHSVIESTGGKLIAIDGKSIRRSFEHAWDQSGMAHMVSAFVVENQQVFAQLTVAGKDNEITAIPKLLALLDIQGATVRIDAMGCQKAIARQIVESGGQYVLALKDNQETLCTQVQKLLDEALLPGGTDLPCQVYQEITGDHGRIETRKVLCTDQVQHLKNASQWADLRSVAVVECRRTVPGEKGMQTSIQRRYFIGSISGTDAKAWAWAIRGHWGVENSLHWQLDVSFDEDRRRIRKDHGAENFSRLCRMALNLLKAEQSLKRGIAAKRLKAGWDVDYLLKLIGG